MNTIKLNEKQKIFSSLFDKNFVNELEKDPVLMKEIFDKLSIKTSLNFIELIYKTNLLYWIVLDDNLI